MGDRELKLGQLRLRARGSGRPALSMFQFVSQPLRLFFALAQPLLKISDQQSRCSNLLAGGNQHRVHITLCLRLLSYGSDLPSGTFYQIES
ncbi:MAG: hypothetical protein QOH65_1428 [Methylobacteriaceae bacterium]|nr:hypothetical protein [Methylobacteriaceae bacterium]